MRGKSVLAATFAAAAALAGMSVGGVQADSRVTAQEGQSSQAQPADRQKETKRTKVEKRVRSAPVWVVRAPRGKRYSASIRQHQRHAAKKRNQQRARKASR